MSPLHPRSRPLSADGSRSVATGWATTGCPHRRTATPHLRTWRRVGARTWWAGAAVRHLQRSPLCENDFSQRRNRTDRHRYTNAYVCLCVDMFTTHAHTQTHTHSVSHTHTNTHTHTHTYTHTHTHTHRVTRTHNHTHAHAHPHSTVIAHKESMFQYRTNTHKAVYSTCLQVGRPCPYCPTYSRESTARTTPAQNGV